MKATAKTTTLPTAALVRMYQGLPTLTLFKSALADTPTEIYEVVIDILKTRNISKRDVYEMKCHALSLFSKEEQKEDSDHYLHIKMWVGDLVSDMEKDAKLWRLLFKRVSNGLIDLADEVDEGLFD
jgi:hypothetical protein